jgi:hypothetical protein
MKKSDLTPFIPRCPLCRNLSINLRDDETTEAKAEEVEAECYSATCGLVSSVYDFMRTPNSLRKRTLEKLLRKQQRAIYNR